MNKHADSPDFMKNIVVRGNCIDVLSHMPGESIHLTFTSPPYYNARDYSSFKTYDGYLDFLSNVFKAVHRVTKEGRFLVVNTSPVIEERASRAHQSRRYGIPFDLHSRLVEIGYDFIDEILWIKPAASVVDRNSGFRRTQKPLVYKANPVTEYVMVYRKHTDKLIDWNLRQYTDGITAASLIDKFNTTNAWHIPTETDPVHSAVFPETLAAEIVKLYSFVGDLVLDPFAGSGTVGRAARSMGRSYILIEQHEKYVNRIKHQLNYLPLYGEKLPTFVSQTEFKLMVRGENE